MNFELTQEQKLLRKTAREFARSELLPGAIKRDEEKEWPQEAIDKMEDAEPVIQHIVSDSIFNIHTINEYEYKSEYKREKKDHEGYQYDVFKDQDIYRDD